MTEDRTTHLNSYRWALVSIAFAAFMVKLDGSIVNISLPTISRYYGVTPGGASWVILSYLLVQVTTMMIFGKLADDIGLKKTFIAGYVIFTFGSLLCGGAPTLAALIASRCIQGLGSAMLITSAFAMVPRLLPRKLLGSAFGMLGTSAGLGVIVGAPAGGFITEFLSWRWVFLVNIPVGALAIMTALRAIKDEEARGKDMARKLREFDILGTVMSFAGLLALVYGLNTGNDSGWSSASTLSSFIGAFVLLSFFFIWEKRHAHPLLDLGLFRNRRFMCALAAAFAAFMVMSGSGFLMPFYLELVKGLDSARTGLVILVFSLVYMAAGPFAGKLSDKVDPSILCAVAMISCAACALTFAFTLPYEGLFFVLLFLVWLALSLGSFVSPNNNQAMRLAPHDEQGMASGVFNTVTSLGLVFGVTLFETVFSRSLPGYAARGGLGSIPSPFLVTGFRDAYVLGALVALMGFAASVMIRRTLRRVQ